MNQIIAKLDLPEYQKGKLSQASSAVINHLVSNYDIIAVVDPVETADNSLFNDLLQAKRSIYHPNEKILVWHYDTDFYVVGKYGIQLYNFFEYIRMLDISPSVFIFMTNHHGIEKEIENLINHNYYNHDRVNDDIKIWANNYIRFWCPEDPIELEVKSDLIQAPFICLCGKQRSHRVFFLCLLAELGILDKGICTWNFDYQSFAPTIQPAKKTDRHSLHILSVSPATSIRDFFPTHSDLATIYQKQKHLFLETTRCDPRTKNTSHKNTGVPHLSPDQVIATFWSESDTIRKAFLYVSVETVFDYPYPYFTEKTFRPILHKRPFVIIGPPGVLAHLRKAGFKTFDDFWSESYDDEIDSSTRLQQVASIVNKICALPLDKIQEMCNNMQEILDYNFNHYTETYMKTLLEEKLKDL